MDMRKLVGRNFARIRREKGLTQEAVEERSGFSQQYLSGYPREDHASLRGRHVAAALWDQPPFPG